MAGRGQRLRAAQDGDAGRSAWLHASWTEWKNLFSFEIYGRDGKLADRRPRRQLRRRAADLLPDAAGDGTARDDDLGVSRRGPIPGSWSSQHFAECIRSARQPSPVAARWPTRRRRTLRRSSSATATEGSPADDHHPQPAAHHARRRRHRPAVLLPRARRLPDRRGDRQVRLHHAAPDVRRRPDRQVLAARARARRRRDPAPDHPRGAAAASASTAPQLEITSMADIPPAPASARRAASPPRCSRRCTRYTQEPRPPARAGRAGVPHRDRPAEGADRQAGPVHRRVRRPHLLPVPARTASVEAWPLQDRLRDALQPRRQPAAVLHRLHRVGVGRSCRSRTTRASSSDNGHDRQPPLRQGPRAAEPGGAGERRPAHASAS